MRMPRVPRKPAITKPIKAKSPVPVMAIAPSKTKPAPRKRGVREPILKY